jgi:hypothetical protein
MLSVQQPRAAGAGSASAGRAARAAPAPLAPVYRYHARYPRPAVSARAWAPSADIVDDADRTKLAELERRFQMADSDG